MLTEVNSEQQDYGPFFIIFYIFPIPVWMTSRIRKKKATFFPTKAPRSQPLPPPSGDLLVSCRFLLHGSPLIKSAVVPRSQEAIFKIKCGLRSSSCKIMVSPKYHPSLRLPKSSLPATVPCPLHISLWMLTWHCRPTPCPDPTARGISKAFELWLPFLSELSLWCSLNTTFNGKNLSFMALIRL